MQTHRKAQLAAIALLLAAAGVGLSRKPGRPLRSGGAGAGDPQDAVYAMLDAARGGDIRSYLDSYTGQMQATLRQTAAETTEPAFARYLKDSNAAIKGVTVSDPQTIADREVQVRVEFVYQDRNEVQTLCLEKGSNGWKILRVDSAERVKAPIPYGTPVR